MNITVLCSIWHFRDGVDAVEEYEYDENGNMTKDLNSNISLVEYNSLNLPSVITFSNNMDNITNIYTSTGTKLRSISSKYAYLWEEPLRGSLQRTQKEILWEKDTSITHRNIPTRNSNIK